MTADYDPKLLVEFGKALRLKDHDFAERILSDPRFDPNGVDSLNRTPLIMVCRQGVASTAKCLIGDPRVEVNKADNGGRTPFFNACRNQRLDIVSLLLQDPRVDVNEWAFDSPFMNACLFEDLEVIKLLLSNPRIDVNATDKSGNTPLASACKSNKTNVIKLLLKSERVNVNKRNHSGETPFAIAMFRGCIDAMVLLLKDKKLDPNSKVYKNSQLKAFDFAINAENHQHVKLFLCGLRDDLEFPSESDIEMYKGTDNKVIHLVTDYLENPAKVMATYRAEFNITDRE